MHSSSAATIHDARDLSPSTFTTTQVSPTSVAEGPSYRTVLLRSPLVRLGTFVVDRIGKKLYFWSGFLPSDLSYFGTSRSMCSAAV